jgi:hypothetical protein
MTTTKPRVVTPLMLSEWGRKAKLLDELEELLGRLRR